MSVTLSTFQVDLASLLSPIALDDPAGNDLRYDPVYDQIRTLRREDDPLPQGVWKTEPKRADWKGVESLCLEVLQKRSKDLQIAAWLIEAWLHLHSFRGVAEGFRAMHALCEQFWDDLYPRIQEGDVEFRVAPIVWLNDKLPAALKLLPLTSPESEDDPKFSLADYEIASQNATKAAPQPGGSASELTLARFQQSVMLTPTRQFDNRLDELGFLLNNCTEFEHFLENRLGDQSPGVPAIRSVVESAATLLTALLSERSSAGGEEPFAFAALQRAVSSFEPQEDRYAEVYAPGRIHTRAEAYQLLAEAADFLARTEPHSPTPYLVRRAIEWGSMSLEELLPELVRNQAELAEIYRLLNVGSQNSRKR